MPDAWMMDDFCSCVPAEGVDPCDPMFEGAFTQWDGTDCPMEDEIAVMDEEIPEDGYYYDESKGMDYDDATPWMNNGAAGVVSATATIFAVAVIF